MGKYYYDKYNVIEKEGTGFEESGVLRSFASKQSGLQSVLTSDYSYWETYRFTRESGYEGLGTKYIKRSGESPQIGAFLVIHSAVYKVLAGTHSGGAYHLSDMYPARKEILYSRGTLMASNIVVENGTYPLDGRHSDGYWYVRGILVNTAPTTPPSVTVPTTVKGGESLEISWGASTDAEGNLSGYILERSVNGATYVQVYKGPNRNFTDTITKGWNTVAYRVKSYDSENAESGYATSATRTVINNTAPTISGTDSNLGDKNLGFLITYQVNDVDTSDSLSVTEKLNGSIIRTINGAPRNQDLEIEITNEKLFSLPLNSENTIEIKVDDQQGAVAYRRYTFRRTNSAPIISGNDEDLGQKLEPFSIDFSVTDNEGNAVTVKTYLNNILKEEYIATDGMTNTFTISREDWYKLPIGQHSIKIEAIDEHGATAVRNYTFTRYDDKIQFTFKNPIENDIMATKLLVTPTWTISEGSIAKVEACNNAFDEIPTWEDMTSQVLISRHYNFTNDIKTAEKWGINIRFTIEKGTATEECIINGFGGAFE